MATVSNMDLEQRAFVGTVMVEGTLVASSLVLGLYSGRVRC